jgi:hypothetical protein
MKSFVMVDENVSNGKDKGAIELAHSILMKKTPSHVVRIRLPKIELESGPFPSELSNPLQISRALVRNIGNGMIDSHQIIQRN